MIAVAARSPTAQDGWSDKELNASDILDGLTYWREHLVEFDKGESNEALTRLDIWERIDMWLERLCQLKQLWWIEPKGRDDAE